MGCGSSKSKLDKRDICVCQFCKAELGSFDAAAAHEKTCALNPASGACVKAPPQMSGRRKAFMVGINYPGTDAELNGCINDVHNLTKLLTETFGWDVGCIRTLTDDGQGTMRGQMPTKANIIAGLKWLAEGAQAGDVLFFSYSGHGCQEEDPEGFEADGMNEALCPCDFQQNGLIADDKIADILVKPLPEGVRLQAIVDACHSGTALDVPWSFDHSGGRKWCEAPNPFHSSADCQLISGCADEQTSADACDKYGAAAGALTNAFCEVIRENAQRGTLGRSLHYYQLLEELYVKLKKRGFDQRPLLTSTQCFAIEQKLFLMDSVEPNRNAKLGRTVHQKFPPQPAPVDTKMAAFLGPAFIPAGAAIIQVGAPVVIGMAKFGYRMLMRN